ncbi:MAG: DUF4838 domain-containing protein, partial [Victivallales bacterium]|nr:DUF4838 domain-containing protein [Victivallales bacterium]
PEEARWHFGPLEAVFYGEGRFGPSHAVYAFLEDELGVRWPTSHDIVIPQKMSHILIYNSEGAWHPELECREIRPGNGKTVSEVARLWFERQRLGYHNIPPFGHAFTDWWKKYGKEHPEYFAMVNGKRAPVIPQNVNESKLTASTLDHYASIISLCPSNPAVAKQIVENWDKKSPYINICENDSPARNACHCDKCLALDPHKKQELDEFMGADRYIHLANEVLKEARKFNPNVKVTMYAYEATQEPSVNISMDPSIVLGIIPTDFSIKSLEKHIVGWRKSGMKEFKFRPNRHWNYTPMGYPIGNARHFFNVFQLMYFNGATNFDYDAPGDKFDFFRYYSDYILMHAMNNPNVSFEHWEREFVQAYAGDAAMYLLKYIHYWEYIWDTKIAVKLPELATIQNGFIFSKQFAKEVDLFYSDIDFSTACGYLNDALSLTTLTDVQRKRLEDLRVFNTHASLMRKAIATHSPEIVQQIREFRRIHNMPIVMQYERDLGDFCNIQAEDLSHFEKPLITLPLFWHFKLDPERTGESKKLQEATDFSKWDGLMPTDSPWKSPAHKYEHPSAEIREKCKNYNGVAWYACEFELPVGWKDKRKVFVHFGAVDEAADVWLNGKNVGSHPFVNPSDWEIPFEMEITNLIDWSHDKQVLTVKVTDDAGDGGIWKRCFVGSTSIK